MIAFYLVYCSIVLLSFVTSIWVFKFNPGLRAFPWLLGLTLAVEITAGMLGYRYVVNPYWLYHFFLPLSSLFLAYFFYHILTGVTTRRTVMVVTGVYVLISLSMTFFFYKLTDFPGLPLNLLGFLLISVSLYALLTLEPIYNISIYAHPVAWICLGFIVFYTGTFFLNGVYNYLVATGSGSRQLIHSVINNGLNCFMYLCIVAGLVASHRLKKFYATEN